MMIHLSSVFYVPPSFYELCNQDQKVVWVIWLWSDNTVVPSDQLIRHVSLYRIAVVKQSETEESELGSY